MNFFGRLFCLIGLLALIAVQAGLMGAKFVDVTNEAGLRERQSEFVFETTQQPYMSGGAAAGDFDGDGWVDLYVNRQNEPDRLYRNNKDGTFENVTDTAFGPDHLRGVFSNGSAWGDIDNDGDLDLYVTTMEHPQHLLYINDGQGSFTEEAVARGADVPDENGYERYGFSAAFGDYDGDGYLDLHVTEWRLSDQSGDDQFARHNTRLLRNRGGSQPGFFDDVTIAAGVATEMVPNSGEEVTNSEGFAPRFSDIDRDGHPDLLIVADHTASRLFWNNGDGTFLDGTVAANVGDEHNGMGSALGDIDNDGDFDWFVTAIFQEGQDPNSPIARDGNRLYRYDGDREFTDITDFAGVREGGWGWGAAFFDYDNDGDLDLGMTNGMHHPDPLARFDDGFEFDQSVFWENDGTGVFTKVSNDVGFVDFYAGKGLLTFDYDKDGDLDVFMTNNNAATISGTIPMPILYRNDGGNDSNWLRIELAGTISNSQAVGTFVTVTMDESQPNELMIRELNTGSHYLGQSETTLHYGLGDSEMVDRIKFEWRDGSVTHMMDVPANQTLSVTQPEVTTGKVVDVALGEVVDFTVMAVAEVTSMAASGLPDGVHLDSGTFALSGSPIRAGRFEINLDGARADGNSSGSIILNVTTTYADWIDAFFPGESDQAIIGVSADPDGDGRGNVEEYAAQSNPSVVDTGLRFEFDLKRDSEAALPTASFSTFSSSSDLTHVVEESTDLVSWTPWGGATELSRVDEGNGIETVTLQRASALGDDGDVFVRVRRVVASSD
ncbi:MAG: CRTAC1 family protein [Verrucomicrobiota bacterium]